MERSSYNQGGNGRGEDGRGSGGRFHPLGGRTRNHPQGYRDRLQEQYGGGRVRAGGGGGGQQTSRTHTYPRQRADQVPDRSGPDREARTWGRLGPGQPVESQSQALTQTQNGLAAVERWALIDFSSADRWNRLNAELFIPKLMNRCKSLGVHMEDPILVHQTNMREFSDVNRIRRLLSHVMEETSWRAKGRLQMIVCVMTDRDFGYKYLKWVSNIEIGVMTQCCLVKLANKASDQYLVNLALKINGKLGGSDVELIERLPRFHCDDHFMFIGADVNHPAASTHYLHL